MSKRLLVVDDDDEIRELLEFDLSHSGYSVDTATNGLDGLNKAVTNSYDLVLLDVMMPKMNGFDVQKFKKIKTGYSGTFADCKRNNRRQDTGL